MTHTTLLLVPLLSQLLTHPSRCPSALFSAASPKWNYVSCTLISYCTAYMLQDGFHLANQAYTLGRVSDDDFMFLAHHVITTGYMCSVRVLGAGHYSVMLLMFFGEVTNPVHNIFLILEKAAASGHGGPNIEYWLPLFGKIFALFYGLVRVVFGPVLGLWITYDLLLRAEGRKNVPIMLSAVWVAAMWAVLHGSLGYALDVAAGALGL